MSIPSKDVTDTNFYLLMSKLGASSQAQNAESQSALATAANAKNVDYQRQIDAYNKKAKELQQKQHHSAMGFIGALCVTVLVCCAVGAIGLLTGGVGFAAAGFLLVGYMMYSGMIPGTSDISGGLQHPGTGKHAHWDSPLDSASVSLITAGLTSIQNSANKDQSDMSNIMTTEYQTYDSSSETAGNLLKSSLTAFGRQVKQQQ